MAASVGVASTGSDAVVELLYLIAWSVWMPVVSGDPKQVALNFTGTVLFSLNDLTGVPKLPPLPFSTDPPIGDLKPSKALHAVRIVRLAARECSHVVVPAIPVVDRQRPDLDGIGSDELARIARESAGEGIRESQRPGGNLICERRIRASEHLRLRICSDGNRPSRNLKVCAYEHQRVVVAAVAVVDGEAAERDRIEADVLAGGAAERAGEAVAGPERAGRDRVGEDRVGVTVDLELPRVAVTVIGRVLISKLGTKVSW